MKFSRVKNNITYLLLALFLSTKMAGFHALFHADDNEHIVHCAICVDTIANNLTPTIAPDLIDFEAKNIEFFVQKEVVINYKSIVSNNTIPREIFSRPPPILV